MSAITLEFRETRFPSAKTFQSPLTLEKFIKGWWKGISYYVSPESSVWEYLNNTNIFFGEHCLNIRGDNSTFVQGERVESGKYFIHFGVPACYKTYCFKSTRQFFRNGVRLRKLVDRLGQEKMIELLQKH